MQGATPTPHRKRHFTHLPPPPKLPGPHPWKAVAPPTRLPPAPPPPLAAAHISIAPPSLIPTAAARISIAAAFVTAAAPPTRTALAAASPLPAPTVAAATAAASSPTKHIAAPHGVSGRGCPVAGLAPQACCLSTRYAGGKFVWWRRGRGRRRLLRQLPPLLPAARVDGLQALLVPACVFDGARPGCSVMRVSLNPRLPPAATGSGLGCQPKQSWFGLAKGWELGLQLGLPSSHPTPWQLGATCQGAQHVAPR